MNEHSASTRKSLPSPWLFFAAVLGWSWLFWIPAAILGISVQTSAGAVLGLLGLLGPMVCGIVFIHLTQDEQGRRGYWLRIIDLKRIGVRWRLIVFLFVPALMTVAVVLDLVSGGNWVLFEKTAAPFLSTPLSIIPFAFAIFFIGPFPEELGWRGYALDRLQTRWNALASSLILGAVWSVWHWPLFFIKDTYQYNQGAWSLWFWLFFVGIIPLAVMFTWIFNNTRRSTLAVILFHFMVVFVDELVNLTWRTNLYSTILWLLAAISVTIVWGAKTLTHDPCGVVAHDIASD